MTSECALKVLSSWLQVAYQNADGTDESSAELYEALQTVFALINRQKEEIEFLRKTIGENAQRALEVTLEEIEKSRVEAITEFAKRLECGVSFASGIITCDDIDNLVKEMTNITG